MKEELIKLVTLQKYDKELLDIESHLDGARKKIKLDEVRLAKAQGQLDDKIADLKGKQLVSEKIDTFLKGAQIKYKEYSYQLMGLKDQKAYDAMKQQLQDLKEEIEHNETVGISVLEEIEELSSTVDLYQGKISEEATRIVEVKENLEKNDEQKKNETAGLRAKRNEYSQHVNPALLKKYERLLGLPNSLAIATVNGRSCTGCYSDITREDLEKVKLLEQIVTCNNCSRILYIPALLGDAD